MKKTFAIILFAFVLVGTLGVAPAIADHGGTHPGDSGRPELSTTIKTAENFLDLIEVITDWIFVFLLVVSVIFIVLAGLQFIMGGGDPTQVSAARTKLLWAAVGIGVALVARGVPAALQNIVGPTG